MLAGTAGDAASLDRAIAMFGEVRPRLFGIAYRMLGSVSEAEDIVQGVWLRWQATDRTLVKDPAAFLATVATRLAINVAKSARRQREAYIGPWLPEPIDSRGDPYLGAVRDEALEIAVLMILEKLAPKERAAFVLREAFDYPFDQIAEILDIEVDNARQLVSRARKHIEGNRRASASPSEQQRFLLAFLAAAQEGDAVALEKLLTTDVESYSDGGGIVRAARIPVVGRKNVARFVAKATSTFWSGVSVSLVEVNGQPGAVVLRDGVAAALVTVRASEQGIDQILWFMRPSKLAAIARATRGS